MAVRLEIPAQGDPIAYLSSFAPAFAVNEDMRAALLGVQDCLRQASLYPNEPLGLLACLTAEEEASSFVYFALKERGYGVPRYDKLYKHTDKVKVLFFAQSLMNYFFKGIPEELDAAIFVERDGVRPKTTMYLKFGDVNIAQEDPLETIVAHGEGDGAHELAIEMAVNSLIADEVPNGFNLHSYIRHLANRRNRCLYGDPARKLKLNPSDGIQKMRNSCISIIVMGFLIWNGRTQTSSMKLLVDKIFRELLAPSSRTA